MTINKLQLLRFESFKSVISSHGFFNIFLNDVTFVVKSLFAGHATTYKSLMWLIKLNKHLSSPEPNIEIINI